MIRFRGAKPAFTLTLLSTLFAVIVVVLGAFTRLVDAGLGCPDWPGCYGHLWAPTSSVEIQAANAAYPDMPVDLNKTWPEMVHRYLASSLGVLIIAIVVVSLRNRQDQDQPFKLPIFLLGLVILQGIFGMWTVTLKLWPQVVTAHLLGGFTTFCLLWLLSLRLSGWKRVDRFDLSINRLPTALALITLLAVVAQVLLGGWTTSNYAALACPDLPTCQGQWIPDADYGHGFNFFQQIGPNYLGGQLDAAGRIAIHYSHRIGAIIVSVLCLMLAWRLMKVGFRALGYLLVAVLFTQVALGVSNVAFLLPLPVAVLHNLVGALLLALVVTVNYRIYREVNHGHRTA